MKKWMWGALMTVLGVVGCAPMLNAAEEETIFTASHIMIVATGAGLNARITLPDGSIEAVPMPGRGMYPVFPRRDPVVAANYKEAIQELEQQPLTNENLDIKRLLCYLYLQSGRNVKAAACYQEAATLALNAHDLAAQAAATNQAALLFWELDERDEAIRQAQQSFSIYHDYLVNLRSAEAAYQQALESARANHDQEQELLLQHQLALLAYALGNPAQSQQYAENVLKLFEQMETPLMGKQRMAELIITQIRALLEELRLTGAQPK